MPPQTESDTELPLWASRSLAAVALVHVVVSNVEAWLMVQATIDALTIAEARARGLPEEAQQAAVPKASRMQSVEAQLMGMLHGGTPPPQPTCSSSTVLFGGRALRQSQRTRFRRNKSYMKMR